MKTTNISFYFVLYIVAIVTVFVITMERDQLLKQRDDDIAHLIEVYVKPLRLTPYADTARFFIDANHPEQREPLSLRAKSEGPVERNDIAFVLVDAQRVLPRGTEQLDMNGGKVLNEGGDGVLMYPGLSEGVYEFKLAGYKKRVIRDGDKMKVIIRDTTYLVAYSERLANVDCDTAVLIARVEKSGVIAPQLTLSLQEARQNWVLGPPLQKKIFIGGVESLERVSFAAGSDLRVERTPGERSFVTLVWDRPSLGHRSFNVTANANRGFGQKDMATTSFSVDVMPATFSNLPPAKGFWGIPFVFDGQIVGMNPLDLSIERLHDGQSLGTRPAVPRDTLVPDKNWSSLQYKVLYRGAVIKEHRAGLSAPPPPQIKWVQQNLDRSRNVFQITATSSDPVGGPVKISFQSQPSGIAQIDKIRGTSFTITVNLETKPSAVFLKLSATDQYGGTSTSAKQFNIPQ